MHLRHIVVCDLSGSTLFFPNYLTNGMIFEKQLLNTKRVFWFSLQFLTEIFFHSKKQRTRYDHKSTCYSCQILMKLEFSRQLLKKTLKYEIFTKIRSFESELFHSGGQTDKETCQSQQSLFAFLRTRRIRRYYLAVIRRNWTYSRKYINYRDSLYYSAHTMSFKIMLSCVC